MELQYDTKVKKFFIEVFNSMYEKDSTMKWIMNVLSMVSYPSEAVIAEWFEEWKQQLQTLTTL